MELLRDYLDQPNRRDAFFTLARDTFGLDFWNIGGRPLGGPGWVPFSFFVDGRVVANILVGQMALTVAGEPTTAFQISTVCTHPDYRKQGLIRRLFGQVHAWCDAQSDLCFLFANDSVLRFYQQFGYRKVAQAQPSIETIAREPVRELRPLVLSDAADRARIEAALVSSVAVSRTLGNRNPSLRRFHVYTQHRNNLYVIDDFDLVLIMARNGSVLDLFDILGPSIPHFSDIEPFIRSTTTTKVRFGFVPDMLDVPVHYSELEEDSLFVRGPFHLEGISFLFPNTAHA